MNIKPLTVAFPRDLKNLRNIVGEEFPDILDLNTSLFKALPEATSKGKVFNSPNFSFAGKQANIQIKPNNDFALASIISNSKISQILLFSGNMPGGGEKLGASSQKLIRLITSILPELTLIKLLKVEENLKKQNNASDGNYISYAYSQIYKGAPLTKKAKEEFEKVLHYSAGVTKNALVKVNNLIKTGGLTNASIILAQAKVDKLRTNLRMDLERMSFPSNPNSIISQTRELFTLSGIGSVNPYYGEYQDCTVWDPKQHTYRLDYLVGGLSLIEEKDQINSPIKNSENNSPAGYTERIVPEMTQLRLKRTQAITEDINMAIETFRSK